MDTFLFYLDLGLNHVLDPNGYDHVLFLAALALPFALKKIKSAVLLASYSHSPTASLWYFLCMVLPKCTPLSLNF